jgi:hypothetical protein
MICGCSSGKHMDTIWLSHRYQQMQHQKHFLSISTTHLILIDMEYRGFIIVPCFNYADGKFDGMYAREGEEKAHTIYRQTLSEVKSEIDNFYWSRQHYCVGDRVFPWLTDAMKHTRQFGGIVVPKIQFDAP